MSSRSEKKGRDELTASCSDPDVADRERRLREPLLEVVRTSTGERSQRLVPLLLGRMDLADGIVCGCGARAVVSRIR